MANISVMGANDFPLCALEVGEWGILTVAHGVSSPGDPVVGGFDGVLFPVGETWVPKTDSDSYRFRKLRNGERIIIEGD